MYTIKRAAELVGVSESTLRAWERRHQVVTPLRTDAGYRLYDDAALTVLTRVRQLVDQGWTLRSAVEEAQSGRGEVPPATETVATSAPPVRAGVTDLADLARSFDAAGLTRLLDDRFAAASFERVVDEWLLPSLCAVGLGWEDGSLSVAGEHFVAHGVARRLAAAYDSAGDNPAGPGVVIGLPPRAHHDLGLLAFATAARRAGLATRYLGADVPAADWARAVQPAAVRCAVLSLPMQGDAVGVSQAVDAVRAARPDVLVAVGGAHQDRAPQECLRLGHQISGAVDLLVGHLEHGAPAPATSAR